MIVVSAYVLDGPSPDPLHPSSAYHGVALDRLQNGEAAFTLTFPKRE